MILYSLILAILIVILISPLVIRSIIKRSIDYFDFKISDYNYFRDILAIFPYESDPIIQRIAIQIPSIKIQYQNKKFTLSINLLKIYLDLKENHLSQIDGFRNTKIDKSKILKNIETIIRQIIEEYKVVDDSSSKKVELKQSQYQRSKSGIINFIVMVILQVVELQVDKLQLSIIENKNQQPIHEFKQEKTQREISHMFKLFTTNRLYKLSFPGFSFSTLINKDEKLELIIKAKVFHAFLMNDFTQRLDKCITIEQPQVNFHMPFGFTSDDCINGSKIFIQSKQVTCEFSPATCNAYKYIKYFRTYQARLLKFIKNDLVVKEKPSRSPMPELVDISIPLVKAKFFNLENQISEQEGFLKDNKCSEVNLLLEMVQVQVITQLHEYTVVKETIQVDFQDMNINALTTTKESIQLCHFQKGSYLTCRDYELKSLKVLKTLDNFGQLKSQIHIHPIAFQLYEAYININQRPYLEFDFELYKTCLLKYIEECKKKYLQEIKLSFSNSVNSIYGHQNYQINSNQSSNASTPATGVNTNILNISSQQNSSNNLKNQTTLNNQIQDLKLSEYLVVDDKILLETILNTENVLDKVTVPYLEQEFQTDFVEMYSYCGPSKISLTSKKPRYFCVQKEENAVYQGIYQYTFNNLLLEKFVPQIEQTEKIFTMESFQQDTSENNEIILQNMKFMLLQIQIKEETFKDVLDIKNNFDIDYLDEVRKKKFVNPYQPPDPFSKPQKISLDFNQFKFQYEFNDGQNVQLLCDFLGKNTEGNFKTKDQKTILKSIKLKIGMRNQSNIKRKQFCEKYHQNVLIEDCNLSKHKDYLKEQNKQEQQVNNTSLNEEQDEIRPRNSRLFDSTYQESEPEYTKKEFKPKKAKIEIPKITEKYKCDCFIQDNREYDIFEIKHIEYSIKQVIPQSATHNHQNNEDYKHKLENELIFDTLTLKINEDMKYLTDYFQELKESTNRVKDFSLQLNLKFPKKEKKEIQEDFNQVFKEPFIIQWKNLSIILEEQSQNTFMMNFQAFIRNYLQQDIPYNERHILLELKDKKKVDPLFCFSCQSLTLQLKPLKFATNFKSIINFIVDVDNFAKINFKKETFEQFSSLDVEAGFIDAKITIRDYPIPLLLMEKGRIYLQAIFAQLKIQYKEHSLRVFYNLLTEFGDFDLNVGLCQASGIHEILKRIKELTTSNRSQSSFKNSTYQQQLIRDKSGTIQTLNENQGTRMKQNSAIHQEKLSQKDIPEKKSTTDQKTSYFVQDDKSKSLKQSFQLSYWDSIRLCYHGKILMSKDSILNFNLLTSIYPYQKEYLKFTIKQSFFMIRGDNIKFYCQDVSIKRKPRPQNETHALKIPMIQAECELNWNRTIENHYVASYNEFSLKQFVSKNLSIFSKLNLPRVEPIQNINQKEKNTNKINRDINKFKRIVKNSEVPFIHYQVDFIQWFKNLPQLRRDQLYLYNIGIKRYETNENEFLKNLNEKDSLHNVDDEKHRDRSPNKDKSNQDNQQTDEEFEEQEKALGKNTDFFSLFIYTINLQLNSKNVKQNILKHISEIKVRGLMSSTRVIFSNPKHKIVSDPEESDEFQSKQDELDPIIGMQFVFDCIQLSFNIFHKPNSINSAKQSFKIQSGYGKLDYMYGSVFREKANLLNLDPKQFRKSRDQKSSMHNPNVFQEYFGLKDMQLAKDMMIFKIHQELYTNFKQMSSIIQVDEDKLKIPKTDYSRCNETEENEQQQQQEQFPEFENRDRIKTNAQINIDQPKIKINDQIVIGENNSNMPLDQEQRLLQKTIQIKNFSLQDIKESQEIEDKSQSKSQTLTEVNQESQEIQSDSLKSSQKLQENLNDKQNNSNILLNNKKQDDILYFTDDNQHNFESKYSPLKSCKSSNDAQESKTEQASNSEKQNNNNINQMNEKLNKDSQISTQSNQSDIKSQKLNNSQDNSENTIIQEGKQISKSQNNNQAKSNTDPSHTEIKHSLSQPKLFPIKVNKERGSQHSHHHQNHDQKGQDSQNIQYQEDFDFNVSSIFFSSDSLVYEQDKQLGFEVQIQDENGVMHKEITPQQVIKNCLSFKGCKLLITSQLNNIVSNVLFPTEYEEENAQYLKDQVKNAQTQSSESKNEEIIKKNEINLINKRMQLTADRSDGKIQTRLKFVLQIEDPQFNLYYKQQKNQMILTSREKCFMIIQSHQLPYDKQKIDMKHNFKLFFRTLDCFSVRKENQKSAVRWVYDYEKTHNIYHIIRATHAVINYTSFNLEQSIVDFSKPYIQELNRARRNVSLENIPQADDDYIYKWNGQPRSKGLDLRVENLYSEIESIDYHCFIKTLEFFSLLLQSEARQQLWTHQFEQKKNELKRHGKNMVISHIQNHLHQKQQDNKQQNSHISYFLQTCIIKILDSHRKPFLDFRLPSLKSSTINYSNNSGHFSLIFGQVTLKNLMEDGDYKDMIQYQGNDLQIRIEHDFVDLRGINLNTEWRAYNRFECFIPPLIVKLTENIFDPIYLFLFQEEQAPTTSSPSKSEKSNHSQSARSSYYSNSSLKQNQLSSQEEIILHYYFGKVTVKDLRISLHYKSASSLKRLNGVSAIIKPYTRENIFNTNKELFDDFVAFLKKQVYSQIFSLLGQKIFGYSINLEN
ncbi:transmembrane protein, putative (macronuclear) [Tetrahymena thermophila SB210]|uniref:Transmembrane protein, putative n=1 Tax=Tetrahymena thermophila (strain SB210) TaxID=312017 RepID=Q248B7_TETTS|nr:transmembrane protein, putative [Tetrahymena thermophila SB210]EAS04128.2 transmembrane protein, putative [Tetrahymena thermophila SB210]|eukprot:XP_001024373.2 transmembrane protein, putative [Tetrahymena thermophila SB210]